MRKFMMLVAVLVGCGEQVTTEDGTAAPQDATPAADHVLGIAHPDADAQPDSTPDAAEDTAVPVDAGGPEAAADAPPDVVVIVPPPCGAVGQPCCTGVGGTETNPAGRHCTGTGAQPEQCESYDPRDTSPTCVACGAPGQTACLGWVLGSLCAPGAVPVNGACYTCGNPGQPSCADCTCAGVAWSCDPNQSFMGIYGVCH